MSLLNSISSPNDVKHLSKEELLTLAEEIRERIIQVTARQTEATSARILESSS